MNIEKAEQDLSMYSNNFGFMRRPLNFSPEIGDADIIILGLPFDMATSGRSGARMGPDAVRKASVNLHWEEARWPWNFKLSDSAKIEDCGDLVFSPGNAQEFSKLAEENATQIISNGKTLLSLGGDHFVTLPLLRAHHKIHGKMALIHFDAHTDTNSDGSPFNHGSMFYHAPKEGLIAPENSIQIGVRTSYNNIGHDFKVVSGSKAIELSVEQITDLVKSQVKDMPVYLTFDIDCLDPAFAPGTGTPVCGGLSTNKVLEIIRNLRGVKLVGMDVVEVSPAYDSSEVTALAAATIALELMYVWVANKMLTEYVNEPCFPVETFWSQLYSVE